jgi:hypothetical protein
MGQISVDCLGVGMNFYGDLLRVKSANASSSSIATAALAHKRVQPIEAVALFDPNHGRNRLEYGTVRRRDLSKTLTATWCLVGGEHIARVGAGCLAAAYLKNAADWSVPSSTKGRWPEEAGASGHHLKSEGA